MIDNTWTIIHDVEKKLGIDFGINFLEYTDSIFFQGCACFVADEEGITIRIGSGLTGRKLKGIIYHELGHCLLWKYKVPRKMLKIFWDEPASMGIKDTDFLYFLVTNTIFLRMFCKQSSHVYSLYGHVNGEEEFCEVLSGILLGRSFSRMNKRIQEKAEAVKAVLSHIIKS